jgi:hypothetical protein
MARSPIPDEQLELIQPLLDDLLTKLHTLLERLPSNTDSALVFEPGPGSRE